MAKEIEVSGCVEVPMELTEDAFFDMFIDFIEASGWTFGGSIRTILDGHYLNSDGTKGKYVFDC